MRKLLYLGVLFVLTFCSFASKEEQKTESTDNTAEQQQSEIHKKIDLLYAKIAEKTNERDLTNIVESGNLRIIAKKDEKNDLFQMLVNGAYEGKDVELWKAMGSSLGCSIDLAMDQKENEQVVDSIANGDGDIGIAKLSYTNERARKVLFSVPYVVNRKALLVNRIMIDKVKHLTIPEALNNKDVKIGVVAGSSYEAFAKELFPNAQIIAAKSWEKDILPKLETGEISATMRDEIRIKMLLKKAPNSSVKLLPIILKDGDDSLCVVVNPKNVKLLLWVNEFIKSNGKTDTVDTLISKYSGFVR